VAGVLTELSAELDGIKHITLGIGVDVNLGAAEFPPELRKLATSLKVEAGRQLSRVELAAALLRELDRDYGRIRNGEFQKVADEWEAQCVTLGRRVSIQIGGRSLRGLAESLDDDGALLLRTEHGRIERIIGGDVTLEK
jgi:BirA family transcriptional regulator, biotin operon repressor / biotin---[acetyl-CoA-carboxylase] ligase